MLEAEKLFEVWHLSSGDRSDILSALEEAFMSGAMAGAMDSDVAKEAVNYFTIPDGLKNRNSVIWC